MDWDESRDGGIWYLGSSRVVAEDAEDAICEKEDV